MGTCAFYVEGALDAQSVQSEPLADAAWGTESTGYGMRDGSAGARSASPRAGLLEDCTQEAPRKRGGRPRQGRDLEASFTLLSLFVGVRACVRACACVCACLRARSRGVCVCVCVYSTLRRVQPLIPCHLICVQVRVCV